MAHFNVQWSQFTVHKKHDIDRDAPYLWVFGIVVDFDTLISKDFVVRRTSGVGNLGQKKFQKGDHVVVPSALDVTETVKPIGDFMIGGVVVVAWENATTRDKVIDDAYDTAADAINKFVKDRIATGNLETPDPKDLTALTAQIKEDVKDTIKHGWTVFQLVPDHVIGVNQCVLTFNGARELPLDLRFTKGSTDYQLEGEMKFIP